VSAAGDLTLHVAEMEAAALHVAAGLQGLGLQPGDPVAVQLTNRAEYFVLFRAALELGLLLVPIVHIYGRRELEIILADSGARALVTMEAIGRSRLTDRLDLDRPPGRLEHVVVVDEEPTAGRLGWRDLAATPGPPAPTVLRPASETAFILYTSGTTSRPKGVRHSEAGILGAVENWIAAAGTDGPVSLLPLPVGHMAGILFASRFLMTGARLVVVETWNAAQAAELVESEGVTSMPGTPLHLQSLREAAARDGRSLATLRSFALSSTTIPRHLVEEVDRAGIAAYRGYGSTEHPVVSWGRSSDPLGVRACTDGAILPHAQVRVVDGTGLEMPPEVDGEILTRGRGRFLGYTDPALDGDVLDLEGWYRTGDIGHVSTGGHLTITDRKSDMVIRGGENLSSREIEDAIGGHPDVAAVAVLGYPDERYGERVCAVVQVRRPVSLEALVSEIRRAGLARHKAPEVLVVVAEMPRSALGKIAKSTLRADLAAGRLVPTELRA
jgi:acyl-CoA synthetase (AMP-forming)/AMP-acid ligase II